jgi:hypothetical protein
MPRKSKTMRLELPSELADAIETEAKRRAISKNDWMFKAFEHSLSCKQSKLETMKQINAKYQGKCLQCGKTIKVSQKAWWARDVGLMCEDCHTENELEGIGDVTLARLYTRKRKLQKTIQGLKKVADELADTVNERAEKVNLYRLGEAHEELEQFRNETLRLIDDYLKRKMGTDQEDKALKNLVQWNEEAKQLQEKIREEIKSRLIVPIKKKKKQVYEV